MPCSPLEFLKQMMHLLMITLGYTHIHSDSPTHNYLLSLLGVNNKNISENIHQV